MSVSILVFRSHCADVQQGVREAGCTKVRSAVAGPAGPLELPQRSQEVYGATPSVPEVVAEAPNMGAGSPIRSSNRLWNRRPHGSAARGSERSSVNRRCISQKGEQRWPL